MGNQGRYWAQRNTRLDDMEHATALADAGMAQLSELVLLDEAVQRDCAILLGSPGAGKSTELARLAMILHERGILVQSEDLRSITQGDRLLSAVADGAASQSGNEPAYLLLDSLDESPFSASTVARLLVEAVALLPKHVRMVIACRTAAWNIALESELSVHFEALDVFQLAPLSRKQAGAIAETAGLDAQAFWNFVHTTRTEAITGSPLMVRMLVQEAKADAGSFRIPVLNQVTLYDSAIRRLLEDPDPYREQTYAAHELKAAASVLAATAMLTGARSFWTGRGESPQGCLDPALLAGIKTRLVGVPHDEPLMLTASLLKQTLKTALFSAAGASEVWFAQQSLAEFLAAQALIASDLSPGQVERLVRGRKGFVAPQVQALSAWLLALSPTNYQQLIREDPASFVLSGAEIHGDHYRKALVGALLELAARHELADSIPNSALRSLTYPELSEDLNAYILDKSCTYEARYLALRMARQNEVNECSAAALTVALDSGESPYVRNSASHAVLDLAPELAEVLAQELFTTGGPPGDSEDQLFGVGLIASLRAGHPLSDIVKALHPPVSPDLFGSYRLGLIQDLPKAILDESVSTQELRELIMWSGSLGAPAAGGYWRSINRLQNSILTASAARAATDDDIRDPLQELVVKNVDDRHSLFWDDSSRRDHVLASTARTELIAAVARAISDHQLDAYAAFVAVREIGKPADLAWFVSESMASEDAGEAMGWAELARAVFDVTDREHLDVCFAAPEESTVYRIAFAAWREPVPLDSERAQLLRGVSDGDDDAREPQPLGEERLRQRLQGSIDDDAEAAFTALCSHLRIDPSEVYVRAAFEVDITSLPGWRLLGPEVHGRISALAVRHLDARAVDPASEIGTDRFTYGSQASVVALVWLHRNQPELITPQRARYWAPALIHCPLVSEDEEILIPLLQAAYEAAPADFLEVLNRELHASEHSEFALRRCLPVLDNAASEWLARLTRDDAVNAATSAEAVASLLTIDPSLGKDLLDALLSDEDRERATACAVATAASPAAWPVLKSHLEVRDELARAVLQRLAYGEWDLTPMREADLSWLWQRCLALFPPQEDPVVHGVHAVSERESVAHFRDRLLPALADRGTPDAVAELERLAIKHVDKPWIKRLWAQASRRQAGNEWQPLEVRAFVELWADPQKRLMEWSGDLLDAVIQVLGEIQARLTEVANPEATLLWNHGLKCEGCRPKSEDDLNDYIAGHLRDRLSGIVVSREVEVNRRGTSGIGERPDILVSVASAKNANEMLNVIIEGKGCWNPEVRTAVREQLIERYVNRMPNSAGLLLAYWFEPAHMSTSPPWTNDPVRSDRESLRAELDRQVAALRQGDVPVRSVVIDASLKNWPKKRAV